MKERKKERKKELCDNIVNFQCDCGKRLVFNSTSRMAQQEVGANHEENQMGKQEEAWTFALCRWDVKG